MADPSTTAASLARAIADYGLTQKEVAAMLGVSDRMVRQVLSGNKPGRNLEGAARQLATEGRVGARPERREQKVRAPGGGVTREKVKRSAAGTPGGAERVASTVETGGRRQTVIEAPARGLGRERARDAILTDLEARRGGARGRGGKRVRLTVRDKNGKAYTLGAKGGYDPRKVAERMRGEGDDPFGWLSEELAASGDYDVDGEDIVGVTLTYF